MADAKKKANSAEFPIHVEGKTFVIPVNGKLETQMKIVNKFGGKALVKSILVSSGNDDVFLSVGKVGGGESIIDNAALSTLRQERPLPLKFGAGDYDITLRSTTALAAEKTINVSLYVQYGTESN